MFRKDDKVICINNHNFENQLTIGKTYRVRNCFSDFADFELLSNSYCITIFCDYGPLMAMDSDRFLSIKQYRKLKLEKIKNCGHE